MKRNRSTKIYSLILCLILIGMTILTSCQASEPLVIKENDKYIVISVTAEAMGDNKDMTLLDYMNILKDKKELVFEVKNGMITSINNIENAADYSEVWMLYTSDTEKANTAWGEIDYKETIYGSATEGAETLKIKEGHIYIWVYKSF